MWIRIQHSSAYAGYMFVRVFYQKYSKILVYKPINHNNDRLLNEKEIKIFINRKLIVKGNKSF